VAEVRSPKCCQAKKKKTIGGLTANDLLTNKRLRNKQPPPDPKVAASSKAALRDLQALTLLEKQLQIKDQQLQVQQTIIEKQLQNKDLQLQVQLTLMEQQLQILRYKDLELKESHELCRQLVAEKEKAVTMLSMKQREEAVTMLSMKQRQDRAPMSPRSYTDTASVCVVSPC